MGLKLMIWQFTMSMYFIPNETICSLAFLIQKTMKSVISFLMVLTSAPASLLALMSSGSKDYDEGGVAKYFRREGYFHQDLYSISKYASTENKI